MVLEVLHMEATRDGGVGQGVGRVGLVILSTDQTLEAEVSLVARPLGLALYFTRIHMEPEVTPVTLAAMLPRIGVAAQLILPHHSLDALGYCCTSASAVLGEAAVFGQLSLASPGALLTTPATAAAAAFRELGSLRVGLVTPYVGEVNTLLVRFLEEQGPWRVTALITFNLCLDQEVAEVTPASMVRAGMEVGGRADVDTVFISCTSLRTTGVVAELESRLGKPVTSSNLALAWHLLSGLRVEGRHGLSTRYGRLFGLDCPGKAINGADGSDAK